MLSESTYAASDTERDAVEAILTRYPDAPASVTRTGPQEAGELRVEVAGRFRTLVFLVDAEGQVTGDDDSKLKVQE